MAHALLALLLTASTAHAEEPLKHGDLSVPKPDDYRIATAIDLDRYPHLKPLNERGDLVLVGPGDPPPVIAIGQPPAELAGALDAETCGALAQQLAHTSKVELVDAFIAPTIQNGACFGEMKGRGTKIRAAWIVNGSNLVIVLQSAGQMDEQAPAAWADVVKKLELPSAK